MSYKELNQRKGVAGLNVLLSIVSMLFMIGIIVMVFVIAGSKLKDSVRTTATSDSTTQNSLTITDAGVSLTACAEARDGSIASLSAVNSTGGETISSGNYTYATCTLTATATSEYNNTYWNVTYTYSYTSNPEAQDSINATYTSIDDVTDWFPTFIVLGAMVVLILLVVIIINSIRKSGITQGA